MTPFAQSRWFLRASLLLVALGVTASGQTPSPFASPAVAPAAPAPAADPDFELTGVIADPKAPLVNLTRLADKRSFWLRPGESEAGVTLNHFDPRTNRATITAGGRGRTLALKVSASGLGKANGQTGVAPLPAAPLPMATMAPRVAVTDEQKATEARMLVSDLLEIGMVQRKAYEEAQRQAAAAKAAGTSPPQ